MKVLSKSLKVLNVCLSVMCILFFLYSVSHAESVVDEGSAMVYIEPLQDLPDSGNPTGWTALDYDTSQDEGKGDPGNGSSGWQTGTYGVGYGDNDDNTTIDNDASIYSVYTRAEFNVADISEVVSMTLEVDYDDGFIAWINGVEVARSPSITGLTPAWNIASSSEHEASKTNPPTYETFDISAYTSYLVNGRNVLAIAVWNWLPNSSDLTLIPKLNLLYSASASPVLTRYPYIQKAVSDSVTIVWNTDVAGDSEIEYGLTQSYGGTEYDSDSVTQHVVTLTGLSAGAQYYYRVSSNGTVLTSSGTTFQTNKDELDPSYTFVVFGDSGAASPGQSEVTQLINNISPDLGLHTGDVVYPDGEAVDYNPKYFIPYKDTIKRVSFYPTLGNHELHTANGQPYLDAFVLPDVESGSNTERYYSFNYANAHFVSLDVVSSDYTVGSDQYNWIESDLAATDKEWKFVYFHKPAYSSNSKPDHGSNIDILNNLSPLFEQYGVDMVFSGHSHNYERTIPIIGGSVSPYGITYVVTGGGGGTLELDTNLNPYFWTAYLESTYHVTKISIEGDYLRLKAVKPDGTSEGEVVDSYTLVRDTFFHELIPPADTTVAPGESLGPIREIGANISASNYQFYIQPYVIRPNGAIVWLFSTPKLITTSSGAIGSIAYSLLIPSFSEEGAFYYGIRLTDLDDVEIDNKSFAFEVSSGGALAPKTKNNTNLRKKADWKLTTTQDK